jgi:hypothetical protein
MRCFSPDSTPGVSMMVISSRSLAGQDAPSNRDRNPARTHVNPKTLMQYCVTVLTLQPWLPCNTSSRVCCVYAGCMHAPRPVLCCTADRTDSWQRSGGAAVFKGWRADAGREPPGVQHTCSKHAQALVGLVRLHGQCVSGCAALLKAVLHNNKPAGKQTQQAHTPAHAQTRSDRPAGGS